MIDPTLDDVMRSQRASLSLPLSVVMTKIACGWLLGVSAILLVDAAPPAPASPFVGTPMWLQAIAGIVAWSGFWFVVALSVLISRQRLEPPNSSE